MPVYTAAKRRRGLGTGPQAGVGGSPIFPIAKRCRRVSQGAKRYLTPAKPLWGEIRFYRKDALSSKAKVIAGLKKGFFCALLSVSVKPWTSASLCRGAHCASARCAEPVFYSFGKRKKALDFSKAFSSGRGDRIGFSRLAAARSAPLSSPTGA